MDGEKRKLPAPVTTTEEFLLAVVMELQALTAAVEKLGVTLAPVELSAEISGEPVGGGFAGDGGVGGG